jgi:hypothetical protein
MAVSDSPPGGVAISCGGGHSRRVVSFTAAS